MNREFKFRVWDKSFKKWFDIKNALCLVINPESTDLVFMTNQGPYKIPDTGQKDLGIDRFVIQQYTGVKDINKKEIYEGDILTNDFKGTLTPKIAKVEFNSSLCGFIANAGSGIFNLSFTEQMCHGQVRVIGNIFENPELLK